jgi:hypothetical protein
MMLAALLALAIAQDGDLGAPRPMQKPDLDLTLRLRVGDAWAAEISEVTFDADDAKYRETYTFTERGVVKALEDGVYTVELARKLKQHRIGAQIVDADEDLSEMVSTERWASGRMPERTQTTEDAATERLARLFAYRPTERPVEMWSSWRVDLPALDGGLAPAMQATWKIAQITSFLDRQAVQLDYVFSEVGTHRPMQATGTVIVDLVTGLPLESKLRSENAPLVGGDGSAHPVQWHRRVTELRLQPR